MPSSVEIHRVRICERKALVVRPRWWAGDLIYAVVAFDSLRKTHRLIIETFAQSKVPAIDPAKEPQHEVLEGSIAREKQDVSLSTLDSLIPIENAPEGDVCLFTIGELSQRF